MTEDNEISDLVDRSKIKIVKGQTVDHYLKEYSKWMRQPLTLLQAKFLTRQFVKRGARDTKPLPDHYSFRVSKEGIYHKLETVERFTPSGIDRDITLRVREETTKKGLRYRNMDTGHYQKKPEWIPN